MSNEQKKEKLKIVDEDFQIEVSSEEDLGPCPDAPEWMSFEAKCEWLRAAPDMWEKGKLKGGVISLLESYCVAIGIARECGAMIENDGKIIPPGKIHPAFKMMTEAMAQAKSIATELRFGRDAVAPVVSVTDEKEKEDDGWDKELLA